MRLDHVSYVTSHDQISDVVNRIGSQIGTTFIDGGIHPKFGTRNFIAPLLNEQYIEVVCPMDHPATEVTPFGQAVKKKENEGGGWLSWVISTDDINLIESRLGRKAVDAVRKKPDGTELRWKQLGVIATMADYQLPFFIQWQNGNHPSEDGSKTARISKIEMIGDEEKIKKWLNLEINQVLQEVDITWDHNSDLSNLTGIQAVSFSIGGGYVRIE